MAKTAVFVGLPALYGAGAYLRDLQVFPRLSRLFAENGYRVILYTPYSLIVSLLASQCRGGEGEECYERVAKTIILGGALVRGRGLEVYLEDLHEAVSESIAVLTRNKLYAKTIYTPLALKITWAREEKWLSRLSARAPRRIVFYSSSENPVTPYIATSLSKKHGKELEGAVLLQSEPYSARFQRLYEALRSPAMLPSISLHRFMRETWITAFRAHVIRLVAAVSPAPLMSSGIVSDARPYGVKTAIPSPANAVPLEALRATARASRSPYRVVFFGRVCRAKGVFELLAAWKRVAASNPSAELDIIGPLEMGEREQRLFYTLLSSTPRTRYLGYIEPGNSLYRVVGEASVLAYPSHQDAFSLTVLEAIAMGLLVVAYDIPAISQVYNGAPQVFTVREGDIGALGEKILELLSLERRRREELIAASKPFIEKHGSWDRVAEAEYTLLSKELKL